LGTCIEEGAKIYSIFRWILFDFLKKRTQRHKNAPKRRNLAHSGHTEVLQFFFKRSKVVGKIWRKKCYKTCRPMQTYLFQVRPGLWQNVVVNVNLLHVDSKNPQNLRISEDETIILFLVLCAKPVSRQCQLPIEI
jgi:hypothetical protein